MSERPHDTQDLYLSPVALELDSRLDEYDGLTEEEVVLRIALATNKEPRDSGRRAEVTLRALTQAINLHGWTVSWVPRGLQLAHDDHKLVLGVPASLQSYLHEG
jgi:hypothetical protein